MEQTVKKILQMLTTVLFPQQQSSILLFILDSAYTEDTEIILEGMAC